MKPLIALDADGVLLNYHEAYRHAWQRAFGALPELKDPNAYWPIDRWNIRKLAGEELQHFRSHFDEDFWTNIPANDGAVEACQLLIDAGFELICVSAIEEQFKQARLNNLRIAGFPISDVVATEGESKTVSPKAAALSTLMPVAFVDDYLPYLRGIPNQIHTALILREPNGSPNTGEELKIAHSHHQNLMAFANWWTGEYRQEFGSS